MIRTRVLVGFLLALGAGGVLIGDTLLRMRGFVWFPCLFAFLLLAGILSSRELLRLFPSNFRPSETLVVGGVLSLLAASWYPVIRLQFSHALLAVVDARVGARRRHDRGVLARNEPLPR